MTMHEFSIIAGGFDPHARNFEDRLFEAGCDDATISVQKGAIILEFAREAAAFEAAVASAIADVEKAGGFAERVEPDHLVSLAEIAKRAGLTRAAVSHYANGGRRESFPAPVSRVTTESPLWDWADVAAWLCKEGALAGEAVEQARSIRRANAMLARAGQSREGRPPSVVADA